MRLRRCAEFAPIRSDRSPVGALRCQLYWLRRGADAAQAAQARAKAARVDSRSGAHRLKIFSIFKQKLFGLAFRTDAIAPPIFQGLHQDSRPQPLFANRPFDLISPTNQHFTSTHDFHVRAPVPAQLCALPLCERDSLHKARREPNRGDRGLSRDWM